MKINSKFFVGIFVGLFFGCDVFASPVRWDIGPESEHLEKLGIEVDCRVDNWRGNTPGSIPFTIRVEKQEPRGRPVSGKSVTIGFLSTYGTTAKTTPISVVSFFGDAEKVLDASFRIQPEEVGKVSFAISLLVEDVLLEFDLKAFSDAAIVEWQTKNP